MSFGRYLGLQQMTMSVSIIATPTQQTPSRSMDIEGARACLRPSLVVPMPALFAWLADRDRPLSKKVVVNLSELCSLDRITKILGCQITIINYAGRGLYQKRAKRGFGIRLERGGKSNALEFMISNMAEPNWVKLSGVI